MHTKNYIGKIVLVQWRDAAFEDDGCVKEAGKFKCPPVITIGKVIQQTISRIQLTNHYNNTLYRDDLETGGGEHIWWIPLGMIDDIQILKPEGNEDEFDESPKQ